MGKTHALHRPLAIALLAALLLAIVLATAAQASSGENTGYWYTVRPGDTWYSVSRATGVPVATLQAHNPAALHPPNYWLYVGEKLWIPTVPPSPPPPPSCGHWYTVRAGDSWSSLARWTGLSVGTLQAANPAHIHAHQWLYVGHTLWIPCGGHPSPVGYWYTVVPGDGWYRVSAKTGVSVAALQAANPSKVRPPNYWLYAGEKLWIPDP